MHHLPALLWNSPMMDLKPRLKDCVDQALGQSRLPLPVRVFIRADDIGAPGKQLFRLLDLFLEFQMPLCLAVVPSWVNRQRWDVFQKKDQNASGLFCWHQHGWRHVTHETQGKKQEFGPVRSIGEIQKDIVRGREKLESLMKDQFTPVFTPPWNRCDGRTLSVIKNNGFKAVSRHRSSMPRPLKGLPDFSVNVDLHTRRENTPEEGWQSLWKELSAAILSRTCGFMIHHQRMNEAAFEFLKVLLEVMVDNSNFQPVHFKNMLHE
jgi:peptidoglycan/xylan/chitin deacetylase (PgdA/CDA1 family)